MANLLEIIKQAAVEAVEASEPAGVLFGTVTSSSPLLVAIDQKLTLSQEFLLLTKNVSDYTVDMIADTIQSYSIKNGLKKGDVVILLKQQGGQKYIVLDKISRGSE